MLVNSRKLFYKLVNLDELNKVKSKLRNVEIDLLALTFFTRDSKVPVSAHTNKGVNVDVYTGTSVLTWGTHTGHPRL